MASSPGDDRVPPIARAMAWVVLPTLVLAFLVLWLRPAGTEQFWAWPLKPPIAALVLAAGYLAGSWVFFRIATGKRWHEISRALPMISVFAWLMAIATIIHRDRFTGRWFWVWLWIAIYALVPLVVPAVALLYRRADPREPEPGDTIVPTTVRAVTAAFGAAELLTGAFLYLAPAAAGRVWPWTVAPLGARLAGSLLALAGSGRLSVVFDRRWSAWRIVIQASALWYLLVIVALIRARSDLLVDRPGWWVFPAFACVASSFALVLLFAFGGRATPR